VCREVEHVGDDDGGENTENENGEKCPKPQGREDASRPVLVVLLGLWPIIALPGIAVTIHRVPLRVTEPVKPSASS
jgi:hypothetical protein